MKNIFLIACLLSFASLSAAEELQMDGLSNENLLLHYDNILTVSSFEQITYLTSFTLAGDPVWEAPFYSEIQTWKISNGLLFVFSKSRSGSRCFLTCLDAAEGKLLWERVISAPSAPSAPSGPGENSIPDNPSDSDDQ